MGLKQDAIGNIRGEHLGNILELNGNSIGNLKGNMLGTKEK